jgi:ornithine cyclodeaminase/alanine dehydrogenase-like protein (mu-crystallin family)
MANKTASTVGIIGTGSQAKTQLSAICCVRPIKSATVFSRNPERRKEFAVAMENLLGISVTPTDNVETLVYESEIIATITNAREPVFSGEALKPGTHINAAGSNHWMRREIDESTIQKCETIVVDDLAQAKVEAGDLIWAAERRAFRWDRVLELGQVVSGQSEGRSGPDAITLFESQGLGTEDVAAGMHIYQKAIKMGMGRDISF